VSWDGEDWQAKHSTRRRRRCELGTVEGPAVIARGGGRDAIGLAGCYHTYKAHEEEKMN
jgi:hypothetical protein